MTGERPVVPVLLDTTDLDSRERHRAVLATLPSYYALSDTASGGVAVVSSAGAGWAERVAGHLRAGASAVLIVIGERLNVTGLQAVGQAARSAGAVVAADLEHAADPAWASIAESANLDELSLIDGLATTAGSPRAAAIRLLVTLAVAVRPLPSFELLAESPDHLALGSTGGSAPVTLAAVRGARDDGQRLDLVAKQIRYEISWPGRSRAAPAVAYTHTAAGTVRAPLHYEAPERGIWQRLHAHVAGGRAGLGAEIGLDGLRAALRSASFTSPAGQR
jgi:hypothetical protein